VNTDSKRIRIIRDAQHSAAFNMACDEALFEEAMGGDPLQARIRFYSFRPHAMTLGVCQPLRSDEKVFKSISTHPDATRRITGGGLVEHDHDVPYTIIMHTSFHPLLATVPLSYGLFHEIIQSAFKRMDITCDLYVHNEARCIGVDKCFVNPVNNDLMHCDSKIAGAAQKRKHGWILHQGSIDFAVAGKATRSEHKRDQFIQTFIDCAKNMLGAGFYDYGVDEKMTTQINELMRHKYQNPEWILRR